MWPTLFHVSSQQIRHSHHFVCQTLNACESFQKHLLTVYAACNLAKSFGFELWNYVSGFGSGVVTTKLEPRRRRAQKLTAHALSMRTSVRDKLHHSLHCVLVYRHVVISCVRTCAFICVGASLDQTQAWWMCTHLFEIYSAMATTMSCACTSETVNNLYIRQKRTRKLDGHTFLSSFCW